MSNKTAGSDFTGIRGILWPIYKFELKKFLPMGIMMMCILFNYTILRDTKDTLIQFMNGGSTEVFSFLKLYCVVPSAIIFMVVFTKMANALSREKLFYAVLVPFLGFFGCFGFIIYPIADTFHMSLETITALQEATPALHHFFPIIGNWSFSLFYILSELWGSVILSMLFWQFANQITKVEEAKRFYGLFGMIGNVGLILSGEVIKMVSSYAKNMELAGYDSTAAWGTNIRILMGLIMVSGGLVVYVYYWMNRNVLTDKRYYDPDQISGKAKKSKPKLSLGQSFKMIFSSKYLGLIAVLVMAYGLCIYLVEAVWKGQIKLLFPGDPNGYQAYMGQFSQYTGLATIVLMFVGNNILRRFSWRTTALVTPVMIIVTSAVFFGFVWYSNMESPYAAFMGTTYVAVAALIGMVQNVLSKGTKYSLFDSTKQMAYIPLDPELKTKGQAAVEVVGGRAGKAGGAAIGSTMLMVVGGGVTFSSLVHIIGPMVIVFAVAWLFSVFNLSKLFEKLKMQRAEEAKEASTAA